MKMDFEINSPPKLDSISPEVLATVNDDQLESALIGYVVENIDLDQELESLHGLSPEIKAWYVAFVVDVEVLNGGFNQLFFNSSAALVTAAPDAFARLGIPEAGDIVSRAAKLLEKHAPALDEAAAAGTIDAFMETYIDQPFSELDDEYAASEEEWRKSRIRFIRDNATAFKNP
jgi:hypothetical protein